VPVDQVGAYLREMRERRGISLDEISRQTRVPARYLEALEKDCLADLPAPVFVRGYIRAYCQVLGEAPEHALARHDALAGTLPPPVRPAPPAAGAANPAAARSAEARSRTRFAALVSLALLVVLGGALFSLTMVVQPAEDRPPAETVAEPPASEVEQASPASVPGDVAPPPPAAAPAAPASAAPKPAPAPAASPAPPASPAAKAAPTPPPVTRPATPPVTKSPPVTPSLPTARALDPVEPPSARVADAHGSVTPVYRLVARATEATWLRVRTEDGRTTEETLQPGEEREWVSNRPFVLTVGNAGGVALELNGTALPPLGASGVVISRLVVPSEPR
jgi:cytoskeleton protein RodZ